MEGEPLNKKVERKIKEQIKVEHFRLTDGSDGCGIKLSVIIVSEEFVGKTLLERQRWVNDIISEEMPSIHAFEMKTWTPEVWKKKKHEFE